MARHLRGATGSAFPRITLLRALRSELVRLVGSPLVPLHLVLGLGLGLAAGAYFGAGTWDALLGADAFFQLLGAGAPLLVGISCGLAADAEREAGEYVNLLGVASRRRVLAAKAITLLALGVVAAALAAASFSAVLAACGKAVPGAGAMACAVLGIAAGSAGLYAVCLAVALRWGRNASIALGAVGLVVALACLGGLANGLVTGTFSGAFAVEITAWVPFTWPARLASLAVELSIAGDPAVAAVLGRALGLVGAFCGGSTLTVLACAAFLADRFEPRGHAAD